MDTNMNMSGWVTAAMLIAAMGGSVGYRLGTRELASVTATLDETRRELEAQADQFGRAKQDLQHAADAIGAAHSLDLLQLQTRASQDERRLKKANADAARRVGALDDRLAGMDDERDALCQEARAASDSASAAQRLAELRVLRAATASEREALACLSIDVPEQQLAALRGD